MKKLNLTLCKICGEEKSSRGFSFHISMTHKIKIEDYILKYEYNDVAPVCKCGCNKPVTIRGYKIMDYKDGHCDTAHFKKGESPKRDYDRWLKNTTKGIREYNKKAKEINPLYRSGENGNFFGKHHTEETKVILRENVEQQIANGKHSFIGNDNGRIGTSKLEQKFKEYLIHLNILHEHSYKISYKNNDKFPRNKYYDFYIPCINTVVEIHGSYWHPQHGKNLSEIQKGNLENDKFKKQLAKDRFYNILTIYDHELDNFIKYDILSEVIKHYKNFPLDITMSGFVTKKKDKHEIELPDYWTKLVDPDSITVQLTPIGRHQNLFVEEIGNNRVIVGNSNLLNKDINCFYIIFAERCDVDKLEVEV